MKMKKGVMVLSTVVLAASLLLSGCVGGDKKPVDTGTTQQPAEKSYTLKLANYFGPDHPQNIALREKFKPMVEKESSGTLKVEIYDNNQLGGEKEFYDSVRNGTVEMGIVGTIMSGDIEKMSVGDWPFLFNDLAHAKKVFTGPIGQEIAKDLEAKAGVKTLGWSANGFRMFSSNKTIKSIEDFKGMRIRMPNIPNYIEMGKALGATVTPLPISEVFTALEQKVADGQDNPIATLKANGWYEVQSDVLESNHVFSPNVYIINGKLWNKLTADQQKVLEKAAQATADLEWELYEKSYAEDKKFLESKEIKFTTPDEKFKKDLENAMKPYYEEVYGKYPWAKEMVDNIKAEG